MSDFQKSRTAFVYGVYYSVVSCAVVNVIALGIWLVYVLPTMDRIVETWAMAAQKAVILAAEKAADKATVENDEQTQQIKINYDLLVENQKVMKESNVILKENQRIHKENAVLIREFSAALKAMREGKP